MSLSVEIISYDADAKRQATKKFDNVPASAEEDTAAQAQFVNAYVALTKASTTTASLIKKTDIDF